MVLATLAAATAIRRNDPASHCNTGGSSAATTLGPQVTLPLPNSKASWVSSSRMSPHHRHRRRRQFLHCPAYVLHQQFLQRYRCSWLHPLSTPTSKEVGAFAVGIGTYY